jgi:biotin transport system substrate-specific component
MAVSFSTPNTFLEAIQPKNSNAKIALGILTVLLGAALITISAKITIPVWPVPVTLQTFAVAGISAFLGLRLSLLTVALYLVVGALGLPVFSMGGGISYLSGPTGGFLFGFLMMAGIIGYASDRGAAGKLIELFSVMVVADIALCALGLVWLLSMSGSAGWIDQNNIVASAFAGAVQPFILWDVLKMAVAAIGISVAWNLIANR